MKENSRYSVADSFLSVPEAHIAKASLRHAGIDAHIQDEHTIHMDWFYSQALGGVKVLVPTAQLETAKKVLATDYSDVVEEQFGEDTEKCQSCGSTRLEPHTRGKTSALVMILLLGFPLLFLKNGVKCEDCAHFQS